MEYLVIISIILSIIAFLSLSVLLILHLSKTLKNAKKRNILYSIFGSLLLIGLVIIIIAYSPKRLYSRFPRGEIKDIYIVFDPFGGDYKEINETYEQNIEAYKLDEYVLLEDKYTKKLDKDHYDEFIEYMKQIRYKSIIFYRCKPHDEKLFFYIQYDDCFILLGSNYEFYKYKGTYDFKAYSYESSFSIVM